jgi:superfamily I DNA and/or RNA helicase
LKIRILEHMVGECGIRSSQIAVLSQYRAQINLIEQELGRASSLSSVHCLTVVKSQGSAGGRCGEAEEALLRIGDVAGGEWDYVVFTTVRSMPDPQIDRHPSTAWRQRYLGSVADDHQVNVALTRVKKGLIIVGKECPASQRRESSILARESYTQLGRAPR